MGTEKMVKKMMEKTVKKDPNGKDGKKDDGKKDPNGKDGKKDDGKKDPNGKDDPFKGVLIDVNLYEDNNMFSNHKKEMSEYTRKLALENKKKVSELILKSGIKIGVTCTPGENCPCDKDVNCKCIKGKNCPADTKESNKVQLKDIKCVAGKNCPCKKGVNCPCTK